MSTAAAPPPLSVPEEYVGLVDDAAVFPPGNSPFPEAVVGHDAHRRASYHAFVGPFVVSDVRLPDLLLVLRSAEHAGREPLAVTVVVTGGAGAIEPAVRWSAGADELELRGVEIALRDEEDLARNARRVTTAVEQLWASDHLDQDVAVHVEPPRLFGTDPGPGWLAALDEVAAMGHRLKFRLGGVTDDAFPGPAEVATFLQSALDRELAFKCTAGLHSAVRHHDLGLDVEQHGFLNVLLATRASLDGASVDEVAAVLADDDASSVLQRLHGVGSAGLVSARRWFTSFGCCDVRDPLEDLLALDLLPDLTLEPR